MRARARRRRRRLASPFLRACARGRFVLPCASRAGQTACDDDESDGAGRSSWLSILPLRLTAWPLMLLVAAVAAAVVRSALSPCAAAAAAVPTRLVSLAHPAILLN